jgi:hypothetical protein
MTTTIAKPAAIPTPPVASPSRRRAGRRRPRALAALAITLAAVAVGTWLIVELVGGSGASAISGTASATAWTPIAARWLARLEVIGLKKQLARAGYSIKVDDNLDPVTKSALANYLQLDATHPLSPFLAVVLEGTVITGFRNPTAWNSRFGLHRLTKFVERPLTGLGGQLDANGNLRPPDGRKLAVANTLGVFVIDLGSPARGAELVTAFGARETGLGVYRTARPSWRAAR